MIGPRHAVSPRPARRRADELGGNIRVGCRPRADGRSAQGAEALREVRAAVDAEGRNEDIENDDDRHDGSQDEDATHSGLPFWPRLIQCTRPNRTILGLALYVNT